MRVTAARRGLGEAQGCEQPLVLAMDLPPGIPRGFFDGLVAVDTTREVEGVEDVLPDGTQGLQLEPFIRAAVMASQGAILRANVEWPGDTKALVQAAPIRIEALSRPSRSDRSAFALYFAASRRVEWDNSTIGILVEGWIHAPGSGPWSPANVSTSNVTARYFRGEVDPGSALKAQAIFRVGTRAFWLMSAPGYEWISYKFVEVTETSAREVLATSGGGC
jgi:hypothetical protein